MNSMEVNNFTSEFYTIRQAVELLGLKRRTLSYWVKNGDVKAFRSNFGYWLIPATEIKRLGEHTNKLEETKQ